MKNLFFLIVLFFTTALSFAQSQVWVSGYTRSNGTYVQGHYRTSPDYTRNNNWSTQGNVNPYTGKAGTQPRDGYSTTKTSHVYCGSPSTYPTSRYVEPTYRNAYSPSTYTSQTYYSTPTPVYTGSRGGTYYINSSGNKSYIR